MSEAIITVENLGKCYRIQHQQKRERYTALRDVIADKVKDLARRLSPLRLARGEGQSQALNTSSRSAEEDFWALKDVSFEIKQGEVVGIIGRNGAGKSTLLKLLSRITEPTTGRIRLRGRVASLLEVGTGFHPELTGRENIFLNGAILGMTRAEIRIKFDEIVAFAEVEKFLDTPVKRYSSGMYVRLAFAVAAHLEPEILIVDEVLAVGDAEFQKKCLGKMQDVSRGGRTVIFVSHNMAVVRTLCRQGLLLERGRLRVFDAVEKTIEQYLHVLRSSGGAVEWSDANECPQDAALRLWGVRVVSSGEVTSEANMDQDIQVQVDYEVLRAGTSVLVSIHVNSGLGGCLFATANAPSANAGRDEWAMRPHPFGRYQSCLTIPANFLNDGPHSLSVFLLNGAGAVRVARNEILTFNAVDHGAMRKEYTGMWIGAIRPRLPWHTRQLSAASTL